jgi:hypothetical protein
MPILAAAQHVHSDTVRPAQLFTGMGNHSHPINTRNQEAQRYFDQGMAFVFGFNHEEAINSFRKASQLDPAAAMPVWGISLALGPNINLDVDPEREKAAYDAVQTAAGLAASGPAVERDYIRALQVRYSNNPKADLKKLAGEYAKAMSALSKKYPDDLDAATLYAEAMMDLRPWRLWSYDGKPAEGTLEIVSVLESVLRRDPNHIGANHYYVHAMEASPNPERALAAGERLPKLAPAAGHLVHMPAHIYQLLGDFDNSARSNETAARVDREYMKLSGNNEGVYPLMYYNHNLHFLAAAEMQLGKLEAAQRAASELSASITPALTQMPMGQPFAAMPWFVLLRFQRWDEALQIAEPDAKHPLLMSVWHFVRGAAYAGKGSVADARRELEQLNSSAAKIPADQYWIDNPAAGVMRIPPLELAARIAEASGDRSGAIDLWRRAAAAQDAGGYSEPPLWYYSVRESLGGALLRARRAAEAEIVFRQDLAKNARSPRALFGLLEALKAQNKPGAEWVDRQFREAWSQSKLQLKVGDL